MASHASFSFRGLRAVLAAVVGLLALATCPVPSLADSQTIDLVTGFNFVGLKVRPSGYTSRSLMQQYSPITAVYRYDPSAKKYVSQLNLGNNDFDGTDLDLAPGVGYILRSTASVKVSFFGDGAAAADNTFALQSGFAMIAFPAGGSTSRDLMNASAAVVGVYRFDPVAKKYEAQLNLGGGDFDGAAFDLVPGTAYLLRSTGAATVTIPGARTLLTLSAYAASTSVPVGFTLQLGADGLYSDTSRSDLTSKVVWTISPPTLGSISASGRLTAGQTPGLVEITAASEGIRSGTLSITLKAASSLASISLNPSTASVQLGGNRQFTAQLRFSDGSAAAGSAGVWSVAPGTGNGTITQAGVFTATAIGTAVVTYTESGVSGTSNVAIAGPVSIRLEPSTETAIIGSPPRTPVVFPRLVFADGSSMTGSGGVWSVTPVTGTGTITQDGAFTPTSTSGNVVVTYTQAGISAIADIVIASIASLSIAPQGPTVALGSTRFFTVTGSLTTGDGVTGDDGSTLGGAWSVLPGTGAGTITSNGLFTPTQAGTVTVRYTIFGTSADSLVTITAS